MLRGRLIPLLVCAILVGALTTVALAQVGSPSPARAAAVRATEAFEISDSAEGQPIFAAEEIGPGGSAKGQVTIEDSGSVPVALTLKREELSDSAGVGGGLLSTQLRLTVLDVSQAGAPVTIYSGPLDSMPEQEAGEMQPGGSRTYEFIATLPDGAPSSQNSLQSASTSVAYAWIATEGSGEGGEEEPPEEPPAGETPKRPPGGGTPESRGGGDGGEGTPAGGVQGAAAGFDLNVPRIGQTLAGGSLVTYVDCEASCRIFVRGKLRAAAHGHHRTMKIRFSLKRPYAPGSKKMKIPIPRGMRNWLRRMPPPKQLKARLTFIAIGTAGGRDVVKKKVRLRVRHPHR
jgi:spore coat-associated protein N